MVTALRALDVILDVIRWGVDSLLGWLENHPYVAGTLFAIFGMLLFGIAGGIEAGTIPLPF